MRRIFLIISALIFLFCGQLFAARYNALQVEHVDLDLYPTKIETLAQGSEVTIGDLHGNAQKLLYFLIKNGVLKLSVSDYRQMSQLIKTNKKKLTTIKLSRFQALLNSAGVSDKALIRFLGDDVCDRGRNLSDPLISI